MSLIKVVYFKFWKGVPKIFRSFVVERVQICRGNHNQLYLYPCERFLSKSRTAGRQFPMPRLSESFTADKIAIPRHMDPKSLKFIAAPMVNQSDLPFRSLAENHGATLTYTQMLAPDRLLNDQEYLEFHTRDLTMASVGKKAPVVVQLCGNDPELVVKAGRKIEGLCDGIGIRYLFRSAFSTID